jgi:hypothetical protein
VKSMFRALTLVAIAVVMLAFAGPGAARAPRAHAAGSCSVGSGRGYGYSYLTSLWVYKVGCGTGRSVAKSHGRAHGWSCHRKILDRSRTQYDAKVLCNASHRRQVQWTYTQNT